MEAQNRLQSNPHDFEARLVLEEVQMKIQNWASVNLKPGQYTGETLVSSLMPKENINSGYQAWAKKVSGKVTLFFFYFYVCYWACQFDIYFF